MNPFSNSTLHFSWHQRLLAVLNLFNLAKGVGRNGESNCYMKIQSSSIFSLCNSYCCYAELHREDKDCHRSFLKITN